MRRRDNGAMSSLGIPSHTTRKLSNACWALRGQFFVAGAMFATWGVHVPTVKVHYAIGEQALGLAMLAAGVGGVTLLTLAGRIVGRFGPRNIALCMGLVCALCVASLLVSNSYLILIGLMLVYGGCASLFDVSINAEASEIERLTARPLMSGFHALFSLGGMVGAAVGAVLPSLSVAPSQHLVLAALVCCSIVVAGCTGMLRMNGLPARGVPLSLPRGPLALIGVLAAIGLIGEGAIYDWSVLFMKQELKSDAGIAALAYASFSSAMASGRFIGDAVRARMDSVTLLRLSGGFAGVGMALALLVPNPFFALFGFALVGVGLSNVVPVLFSAAARVPGTTAAHGIAAVSSVGYLGMMAGPPLVGVIAESSSLSAGLFIVVIFSVLLAAFARRALP